MWRAAIYKADSASWGSKWFASEETDLLAHEVKATVKRDRLQEQQQSSKLPEVNQAWEDLTV